MKHYITVQVVDRTGRPRQGIRVNCQVHRCLSGGFRPEQRTDSDGRAEFELADDSRITIYVNGSAQAPTQRQPAALIRVVL